MLRPPDCRMIVDYMPFDCSRCVCHTSLIQSNMRLGRCVWARLSSKHVLELSTLWIFLLSQNLHKTRRNIWISLECLPILEFMSFKCAFFLCFSCCHLVWFLFVKIFFQPTIQRSEHSHSIVISVSFFFLFILGGPFSFDGLLTV